VTAVAANKPVAARRVIILISLLIEVLLVAAPNTEPGDADTAQI